MGGAEGAVAMERAGLADSLEGTNRMGTVPMTISLSKVTVVHRT